MPNGYHNKQVGVPLSGGKALDASGFMPKGAGSPKINAKPAFGSPGLPGKTQPKDRSGGVKRGKLIYADKEGL
jgi:hypothetical protein